MQTSETGDFFGFKDAAVSRRGCAPISTSSILIDCGCTSRKSSTTRRPGGRRLVQRADGYRATLVTGTPLFENARRPARTGRLARAGR
jgi:hypothetical protein